MKLPRFDREEPPNLQEVVDALDDPDCRTIIRVLEEPMTASEIADATDIPLSTTYRKLSLLSDASLLEEGTEIRADGHHTTIYLVAFDAVRLALDDQREFEVSISRPSVAPDEQLRQLWSEIRKET